MINGKRVLLSKVKQYYTFGGSGASFFWPRFDPGQTGFSYRFCELLHDKWEKCFIIQSEAILHVWWIMVAIFKSKFTPKFFG